MDWPRKRKGSIKELTSQCRLVVEVHVKTSSGVVEVWLDVEVRSRVFDCAQLPNAPGFFWPAFLSQGEPARPGNGVVSTQLRALIGCLHTEPAFR